MIARLEVFHPDSPFFGQAAKPIAHVSRIVVTANGCRLAAPGNNLLDHTDHAFWWHWSVNLYAQFFPVEVGNHVEQSDDATVFELVMHEARAEQALH